MSVSTVITQGYGSFGNVYLLPTLGYGAGGGGPALFTPPTRRRIVYNRGVPRQLLDRRPPEGWRRTVTLEGIPTPPTPTDPASKLVRGGLGGYPRHPRAISRERRQDNRLSGTSLFVGAGVTLDDSGRIALADDLTPGSVIFVGADSLLAEDNANFFWDDTNNQLLLGGTAAATADIVLDATGSAVFNEQGLDKDFRVEGLNDENLFMIDASDDAVKIGQDASSKIGLYGVTPVAQPAALTAQETTITHTAPGTPDYAIQALTNSSPFGFVTADEGHTLLQVVANLQTRVQELEDKLQALGAIG